MSLITLESPSPSFIHSWTDQTLSALRRLKRKLAIPFCQPYAPGTELGYENPTLAHDAGSNLPLSKVVINMHRLLAQRVLNVLIRNLEGKHGQQRSSSFWNNRVSDRVATAIEKRFKLESNIDDDESSVGFQSLKRMQ